MAGPISVLLPAFNEEAAIGDTVRRLVEVMAANALDGEIVVIDDGSTDATAELARAAGASVVRHPHNVGYGRALKRGILQAAHDTIVICDADGSYPVAEIPALLAKHDDGFDMVIGARTGFRDGWLKAPLRRLLRWLVEYTCGRRIEDVNSGLRVFERPTVTGFLPTLCDTFSFTTSLTLAYNMTGLFVGDVPISYQERRGRTKVRLVRDTLRTLQYIVQAIIYYNPLKLFLLFSAMCGGFAGVAFVGAATLDSRMAVLVGAAFLMAALIVFCLGLLADLLKQILSK